MLESDMKDWSDQGSQALLEGVTGAKAQILSSTHDGRTRVVTARLDWGDAPGSYDLSEGIEMHVGPYGDFEARLDGSEAPFSKGTVFDVLKNQIRIGVLIHIDDHELFRASIGKEVEGHISVHDMTSGMINLPIDPEMAGLARISVTDMALERDNLYFEVVAVVEDMPALISAARTAYFDCWGDQCWIPKDPREALFELALGSNGNPSPDEMGFSFLEFPETRFSALVRRCADRDIARQPSLVPDPGTGFDDWVEMTGKDPSFVGNGYNIPGTRDLYDAAMRAVPSPGESFEP